MNDQTIALEIPATAFKAAYMTLPPQGRVIVAKVTAVTLYKDNLQGTTFYNRHGVQVYPTPDKTGFIRYHQGFVVHRSADSALCKIVFIYLVCKPKKGQKRNENR